MRWTGWLIGVSEVVVTCHPSGYDNAKCALESRQTFDGDRARAAATKRITSLNVYPVAATNFVARRTDDRHLRRATRLERPSTVNLVHSGSCLS
jgi:hypothetical protein